jgi:hypothetical protein
MDDNEGAPAPEGTGASGKSRRVWFMLPASMEVALAKAGAALTLAAGRNLDERAVVRVLLLAGATAITKDARVADLAARGALMDAGLLPALVDAPPPQKPRVDTARLPASTKGASSDEAGWYYWRVEWGSGKREITTAQRFETLTAALGEPHAGWTIQGAYGAEDFANKAAQRWQRRGKGGA